MFLVDWVGSSLAPTVALYVLGRGGCMKTRENPGIAKIGPVPAPVSHRSLRISSNATQDHAIPRITRIARFTKITLSISRYIPWIGKYLWFFLLFHSVAFLGLIVLKLRILWMVYMLVQNPTPRIQLSVRPFVRSSPFFTCITHTCIRVKYRWSEIHASYMFIIHTSMRIKDHRCMHHAYMHQDQGS